MKLHHYLPQEHIMVNLRGQKKIEVIEEMLLHMKDQKLLQDYELALNDTLHREGQLSTGLENGLAIPHAKTDGIDKMAMVFGYSREGVDFDSLDGKPAHLFFLVLSPLDTSGPHIQALALITRNIKEKSVRDALRDANDAGAVAALFESFD